MAVFPGPRWSPDEIAAGLIEAGFTGWSVRTMGAIVQAESLGFVWAHGLNHEGAGTPANAAAYLAEGHGLLGLDDYWIMRTWNRGLSNAEAADPAGRLMRPYWAGTVSFSQLAKDPAWNLAMGYQVFLANAYTRGWSRAYEGWSSYKNGRHEPFLAAATVAAKNVGAI